MRNKKQRKQRKTITRTRQYLHGLVICLRPRSSKDFTIIKKEYRVQNCGYNLFFFFFFLIKNTATPLNIIRVRSGRVVELDQTKLGSTKPNKPSFVNLQKTSQILLTLKIILFHHKQISYSQKLEPLSNDFIAKHAVQDA